MSSGAHALDADRHVQSLPRPSEQRHQTVRLDCLAAPRLMVTSARFGAPFVFLHGLTFDSRMWAPVLDALPSGHRAIAFDLPGHGGSAALAAARLR